MNSQRSLQHFILTRFNLLLWNKDKEGNKVRTMEWLEHRFALFENYCLPSIKNQTCQEFVWIVLFDSTTPDIFKNRIADYEKEFPQLCPIYVEPANGRYFAEIFRKEMVKRLNAIRVVSTYLDNDDSLNKYFVEDLQHRAESIKEGTFINYNDGYQFYSEDGYLMRIHYPANHFVSVVEKGDSTSIKGVFGYGSHAYLHTLKGVHIEHIRNLPMWCEMVHMKNMINDAFFLFGAKMVRDDNVLKNDFGVDEIVKYSFVIYLFKFLPRYAKTFARRAKHRVFGKRW